MLHDEIWQTFRAGVFSTEEPRELLDEFVAEVPERHAVMSATAVVAGRPTLFYVRHVAGPFAQTGGDGARRDDPAWSLVGDLARVPLEPQVGADDFLHASALRRVFDALLEFYGQRRVEGLPWPDTRGVLFVVSLNPPSTDRSARQRRRRPR